MVLMTVLFLLSARIVDLCLGSLFLGYHARIAENH